MDLCEHHVEVKLCLLWKALTFRHADPHHLDVALVDQNFHVTAAKEYESLLNSGGIFPRHAQPAQKKTSYQFDDGKEQFVLAFEMSIKRSF